MRVLPCPFRVIVTTVASSTLFLPRAAIGGVSLAREEARDDAALRAMLARRLPGRDIGPEDVGAVDTPVER